jgi:hypothetical protein
MKKVVLSWGANWSDDYEYTDLLVSSDEGHALVYKCVRNDSGSIVAGADLSDPMVVLPMLLRDLGIEVIDTNGLV